MRLKASHMSALSRLFSAGVFHELAREGRSPLFARLIGETPVEVASAQVDSVGDAFDEAFKLLRMSGLRSEYIYRTAIVRNVLLGTHSLNSASMLTEFRTGQSKADLVILNGTAAVYEIKSERDSLARLEKQINDYQKVFAKVFVIAGADHVDSVAKLVPENIGVMCLRRWNRIGTIREAVDGSEFIEPASVLESLRSGEAVKVLEGFGVSVPDVPNTVLRKTLMEEFRQIEPTKLHRMVVATLKETRSQSKLANVVGDLPFSLQAAALTYKLRGGQYANVLRGISTPLKDAMRWA